MLHRFFCDEYLGDISPEQLSTFLLSLTNTNDFKNSIPEIFGDASVKADNRLMVMG